MFVINIVNRLRGRSARGSPRRRISPKTGVQNNSESSSIEVSSFSFSSTRIEALRGSGTTEVNLSYMKNGAHVPTYCQAVQQGDGKVLLLMNLDSLWAINNAAKFKHKPVTVTEGKLVFTLQNESIAGFVIAKKLTDCTYTITIPEVTEQQNICNFVEVDKKATCTGDKDKTCCARDKCFIEDTNDGDNYSFKIQDTISGCYLKVDDGKIIGTVCCCEATVFSMDIIESSTNT